MVPSMNKQKVTHELWSIECDYLDKEILVTTNEMPFDINVPFTLQFQ